MSQRPRRACLSSLVLLFGCSKGQTSAPDASAAKSDTQIAATSSAVAAPAGAFRGTIDGTHAVVMHLANAADARSGAGAISGFYYYVPSGDDLDLRGSMATDGSVHLDETLAGKATGAFDGHWDGRLSIDGTWTDPAKKKSLPFHLDVVRPVAPAAAVIVERRYEAKKGGCAWDVKFPDLLGAVTPPESEMAVNAALRASSMGASDDVTCDGPMRVTSSYKVPTNAAGILSIERAHMREIGGGADPVLYADRQNLALPAGSTIKYSDILAPAGRALVNERLVRSLDAAALPPETRNDAKARIAKGDVEDFVIDTNDLQVWLSWALPLGMTTVGRDPVKLPLADLAPHRVTPSPVDALWRGK